MSKPRLAEHPAPVEMLLRQVLDGLARIEAKLDRPARIPEAHEHRFLAATVEHCGPATFTTGEIFTVDCEAIQTLMWIAGDTPHAVAALFARCEGHRIGNVRLTRVRRAGKGNRWRWEP